RCDVMPGRVVYACRIARDGVADVLHGVDEGSDVRGRCGDKGCGGLHDDIGGVMPEVLYLVDRVVVRAFGAVDNAGAVPSGSRTGGRMPRWAVGVGPDFVTGKVAGPRWDNRHLG